MGESRYEELLKFNSPRTCMRHNLIWGFLIQAKAFFIQYLIRRLKKVNLNRNFYIWKENIKIRLTCFKPLLRACETIWSAREIASVALSAEQQRHTENVFHMRYQNISSFNIEKKDSLTKTYIEPYK